MTHSKGVMEESSNGGPIDKDKAGLEKSSKWSTRTSKNRKPLITTPSVRAKGTERGTVVEGGVLSFRGNPPPSNLGTKYPFLTLSASSDHFLVPPTGPNQQEARVTGAVWVKSWEVSLLGYSAEQKITERGFMGQMENIQYKTCAWGSGKAFLGSASKELL